MSPSPDPELDSDQAHSAKVVSIVTHHTVVAGPVAASGVKSRSKPKEKKETKTKEFQHSFEPTSKNYLTLLRTILAKHGEEKYNITAKLVYSMKVQLPGVK